jgi:hypothetical protein
MRFRRAPGGSMSFSNQTDFRIWKRMRRTLGIPARERISIAYRIKVLKAGQRRKPHSGTSLGKRPLKDRFVANEHQYTLRARKPGPRCPTPPPRSTGAAAHPACTGWAVAARAASPFRWPLQTCFRGTTGPSRTCPGLSESPHRLTSWPGLALTDKGFPTALRQCRRPKRHLSPTIDAAMIRAAYGAGGLAATQRGQPAITHP